MKKGFIFVETMVCIAFLSTVLLAVYASFTTVLDNAKTRLLYDDPVYLYRSYYILNFLEENNINEDINHKFAAHNNNTTYLTEFGCSSSEVIEGENSTSEKLFCEKLLQSGEWNVNHIFIMPYNVNKVVGCVNNDDIKAGTSTNCRRNTALKNLSVQAVNYLYSLDGYTGDSPEDDILSQTETNSDIDPSKQIYRIVIEFKVPEKTETYDYYDYCVKNDATCSGWDKDAKKQVTITSYKYYYTSLEIPNGNNAASNSNGYGLKLYYHGNGGTWCGTGTRYKLLPGSSIAFDTRTNLDYIYYIPGSNSVGSSTGLGDYNNKNSICFSKTNKVAINGKEWNTKPEGNGISYGQTDTAITVEELARAANNCDLSERECSLTLYVNWVDRATYHITYNLNDGINSSSNPNTYRNNQTIKIYPATRDGYTFMGWTSISEGFGEPSKADKEYYSFTRNEGDKDFTAHWCERCDPSITNGTCTPKYVSGTCQYETSCNTGYHYQSGANTKKPVCVPNT